MKTNKFIENSKKEVLDRLKESFANKDIDIEVLTNTTEKYNKLCEELDILNSYKTIFGIN